MILTRLCQNTEGRQSYGVSWLPYICMASVRSNIPTSGFTSVTSPDHQQLVIVYRHKPTIAIILEFDVMLKYKHFAKQIHMQWCVYLHNQLHMPTTKIVIASELLPSRGLFHILHYIIFPTSILSPVCEESIQTNKLDNPWITMKSAKVIRLSFICPIWWGF